MTDAELVERYVKSGDESAFAEIASRHGPMVYATCLRRLGDSAAAEDAVQAVFMLLARKARGLSRREALAGWLHGAADLVAREGIRAARRRRRAEREAAEMRVARSTKGAPGWSRLEPEVDAALEAMPRRYRDAVVLSCIEGRSEAETARELGIAVGTVKSRVSRGLARLRARLGRKGVALGAAALGAMLAENGVRAMPPALAAKVAGLGAAGAATVGAGSASLIMMEGAMKAMFVAKMKVAAVVAAAVLAAGASAPVAGKLLGAEKAPEIEVSGQEKTVKCRVLEVLTGRGRVVLGAGSSHGVRAGFEFDVKRDRQPVAVVRVVAVEENRCTAEAVKIIKAIEVGDEAETRLAVVGAEKEPAAEDPAKIAWGEAVNGLQVGLVPLGGEGAWDGIMCPKCQASRPLHRMLVMSKCSECGAECGSNRPLKLCKACAEAERACHVCAAEKPASAAFIKGQPMRFEFHLRNVGEKELRLKGGLVWPERWRVVFEPKEKGVPRAPRCTEAPRRLPPADIRLPKGAQTVVAMVFDDSFEFEHYSPGARKATAEAIAQLAAGRYTVTANHEHARHAEREICPYWHGKVITAPVEIEIKAEGGAWTDLFSGENWYKNQGGAEKIFTGTLEAVAARPGMATTLMRTSHYRLGRRTIYTGARKVPELDALVGKKVEIRGKGVDMALEGREISEIWPAAVREAGAEITEDRVREIALKAATEKWPGWQKNFKGDPGRAITSARLVGDEWHVKFNAPNPIAARVADMVIDARSGEVKTFKVAPSW